MTIFWLCWRHAFSFIQTCSNDIWASLTVQSAFNVTEHHWKNLLSRKGHGTKRGCIVISTAPVNVKWYWKWWITWYQVNICLFFHTFFDIFKIPDCKCSRVDCLWYISSYFSTVKNLICEILFVSRLGKSMLDIIYIWSRLAQDTCRYRSWDSLWKCFRYLLGLYLDTIDCSRYRFT